MDVTERRESEDEIRRLNATLERRVASRTRSTVDAFQEEGNANLDFVSRTAVATMSSGPSS